MRTLFALLASVVLAVAALLGFGAVPAQAAGDSIENLLVTYDIQADGAVKVTYEVEWKFGEDGQHGIDHSIVTRERSEAAGGQDVVYDISKIAVDSPSGAPDQFTERREGSGSRESIELRIGDPDVKLESRDATYVITYEVRGALRTVEDMPEFFWDVTSRDNPRVDRFEVRVTAPGGVTRARCLVGTSECESSVVEETAILQGGDVPSGTTLSVVAGLDPRAVDAAEQTLETQRLGSPELQGVVGVVDIRPDGEIHVEQDLTYRLAHDWASSTSYISWNLPTRMPFTAEKDHVYEISNLQIDGALVVTEVDDDERETRSSTQSMDFLIEPPRTSEIAVFRLAYDVRGVVAGNGERSEATWILVPDDLTDQSRGSFTWKAEDEVRGARCVRPNGIGGGVVECPEAVDLVVEGTSVTWEMGAGTRYSDQAWIGVELDSNAVGGAVALLEPSLDAAARRLETWSGVAAVVVFLVLSGAGLLIGRARITRSRRWADVPPGVKGRAGAASRATAREDIAPVRFEEPDCSLALAGLVLDRRPKPQHTAAILVRMASVGALRIQSAPLVVESVSKEGLTDPLELELFDEAKAQDSDRAMLRRMNAVVAKGQGGMLKDRSLFGASTPDTLLRRGLLLGLLLLVLGAVLVPWVLSPEWLGPHTERIVVGAILGVIGACVVATRFTIRAPLASDATALSDQAEGFRQFIATAEAVQLNFEAGQDVYRRYLPWAVLFGLTERWTQVCAEMAAAGRIPAPDMSFWSSAHGLPDVAAGASSLAAQLRSAGSGHSDGDGGSVDSGFSGGSGGGDGGGGSSSSSW